MVTLVDSMTFMDSFILGLSIGVSTALALGVSRLIDAWQQRRRPRRVFFSYAFTTSQGKSGFGMTEIEVTGAVTYARLHNIKLLLEDDLRKATGVDSVHISILSIAELEGASPSEQVEQSKTRCERWIDRTKPCRPFGEPDEEDEYEGPLPSGASVAAVVLGRGLLEGASPSEDAVDDEADRRDDQD